MLENNSSDKNFQIVEILEVLPKTIIKQILNVLTIPWFLAINTSNDVQYTKLEHRKTWHMSQSVETSIIALIWSLVRISLFVWAVAQGRAKKSAKQQGRWDFFAVEEAFCGPRISAQCVSHSMASSIFIWKFDLFDYKMT